MARTMPTYTAQGDPLWPMLLPAIESSDAAALRRVLTASCRHPALDEAVVPLGDASVVPSGTAHAAAIARFFRATHACGVGEPRVAVASAASVCRVLIEANAPVFSANMDGHNGSGRAYAAEKFVRMIWPCPVRNQVRELFFDYLVAGYIDLEQYLDPNTRIVGGLLPLDAAIRLGNGPAAAALIEGGCLTHGIAMDDMGRETDLLEYAWSRAPSGAGAETLACIKSALMTRAMRASESAPPRAVPPAPARRRASL